MDNEQDAALMQRLEQQFAEASLTPEQMLGFLLATKDTSAWFTDDGYACLAHFRDDPITWPHIVATAQQYYLAPHRLESAVDAWRAVHATTNPRIASPVMLPPPETGTQLIAAAIPQPLSLLHGLMHEGMLMLGGKSKRGKSWMMFDLAVSVATGSAGFLHFPSAGAQPVLYLALEDGRARLQGRLQQLRPGIQQLDLLHLRYAFPPLLDGGIEALEQEITREGYGLVVIDVLAKLEPVGKNGAKSYHETYEMFAPLQALRQKRPFCLAMLTHLRKSDADDMFDGIMGSTAYQGAQDVLWVLERKPKDDFAFLHIRDKDAEDKTIALRFVDGHWEYVGEGEEYEVTRDQRRVLTVLQEEKRIMTIPEVMKSLDAPDVKYGYFRKLFMQMAKDDLIHRTQQGKYSATVVGYDDGEPF